MRELLTPTTLIPVILMAFFFGAFGHMVGGMAEEVKEKPTVGLIDEDNGHLSGIVTGIFENRAKIVYSGTDVSEGLQKVKEEDGVALLAIPPNFSESIYENHPGEIRVYWVMKGAGQMDLIPTRSIDMLIQITNQEISKNLIEEDSPVDPKVVLNLIAKSETTLFKGRELKGLSPGAIGGVLSSQAIVIPLIIVMVLMAAGSAVIGSMGMEKENKTLETLLTLPVKREHIVTGKIAGSAIAGFVMGAIYMAGFAYYMRSLWMERVPAGVNLADLGLALGPQDYLLLGLSVFMGLFAGLSLCMILGSFAGDYKSAQTLITPIMFLALIPMFLIMFKDFDTLPMGLRIFVFLIPFSHPMMTARSLMLDDYVLVLSGIAYVAIFSAITIAVVVRIFKTDRLLTGRIKVGKGRLLRGLLGKIGR